MVKKWAAEFKRGRVSIADDHGPGRPTTATNPHNVAIICEILMKDPRLKVREIADIVGISYERIQNIIVNELGLSRVSTR